MENKITNIELQKNNKNRVNIYIDESYAFSCDAEIIYRYGLKIGSNIDIKELKKVTDEDNFIKAKNSALRTIEKTYKSEKQIKDKLIKQGYDETVVLKTIGFLKEYDFINDYRYVDMYIKEKSASYGIQKMKYSLLMKGIPEEIINEKLQNIDKDLEREAAKKIALKKYNVLIKRELDSKNLYRKLYQHLLSKGYSYECIKSVVSEVLGNSYE